jgi:hypothetical protein
MEGEGGDDEGEGEGVSECMWVGATDARMDEGRENEQRKKLEK